MGQVLVAYADGDADIGGRVAAALADAGVDAETHVGAPHLKSDKSRFDDAGAVVLVWSRRAAQEASLRREAAVARERGKLVIATVDGARPPPSLRTAHTLPVNRSNVFAAARKIARALPAAPTAATRRPAKKAPSMNAALPEDTTNYGSTWKGTILIGLIVAGIAYGAAAVAFGPSPQTAIMALFK